VRKFAPILKKNVSLQIFEITHRYCAILTFNFTNKLIRRVAVNSFPLTVVVVAKVAKTHCGTS
jgi:hypothetical protein